MNANTYHLHRDPNPLSFEGLLHSAFSAPDSGQLERIEAKLDELLDLERRRQDAADLARLTAEWHRRHR